ncbi:MULTISPECIES: ATP-binding protein [unclassified Brenneria]|uniref:ATP-binding protein n=1 Tax=unclassified Brenneria TaxID=2634434 RepID=UPI0015538D4B|nr:ATP-binding protein [Brenneria sp. hezel4-2-4]MEE3650738.1 ATP-binding protein [Brenneria sp. HEZEL_4_2_4]NPD00693.1 HAMP domain-containing protein [Brenneria sp. hezel4-2-4]
MTISNSLRWAFAFGAVLTLSVSAISLYSWREQSSQIRYALNEYFPKIQASFQLEDNLNILIKELNEFLTAESTSLRLQRREQILSRLNIIHKASRQLTFDDRHLLEETIRQMRSLLTQLDGILAANLVMREKANEMTTRINWLHDDFNLELTSLSQDISWQQSSLLDQFTQSAGQNKNPRLQDTLRNIQDELQLIYTLAHIENQIVDDLREQLADRHSENLDSHIRYLNYLRQSVDDLIQSLSRHPSTVTLRQTIDELLALGLEENKLPAMLRDRSRIQASLRQTTRSKEQALSQFRHQIEQQLGNNHQQLQTFNQRLEHIMNISGMVMVIATLLALLFAFILNHVYIRSKLIKRFTQLNQAVARLGYGDLNTSIPVYGRDELGRIAGLLRNTLHQIKRQRSQLEQEITERKAIENNLRTAQDELIQAAKLATVGQTMTTLAHEINQPLNALSLYLFTSEQAVNRRDRDTVAANLTKMRGLLQRIDSIIRQLRQFSRRSDSDAPLGPIDLRHGLLASWELLALRHRPLNAQLILPETLDRVIGEDIRVQQVLVNLLTNALEATSEAAPRITISQTMQGGECLLLIEDNGPGWPLILAPRLLKPFTTSKDIGLGIGLSISQSIMRQCGGELYLASTLDRHALVILQFRKSDDVN